MLAEFHDVCRDYPTSWLPRRTLRAVDKVSLRIEKGEVLGLLGPNRAGKTTLVKLLLTLCRPTAGTVSRLGQAVDRRETLARGGYVHENHAFPRYLTPAALLEYYGALALVPYELVKKRVPQLL